MLLEIDINGMSFDELQEKLKEVKKKFKAYHNFSVGVDVENDDYYGESPGYAVFKVYGVLKPKRKVK